MARSSSSSCTNQCRIHELVRAARHRSGGLCWKSEGTTGKVEHHAQLSGLMLRTFWQRSNHRRSTSGESASTRCRRPRTACRRFLVSQLVFSGNPEIPGNFVSDNPNLIANFSMLRDRETPGQAARFWTIARTKLMKLNATRALDTRPRVVPTFLQGDMVAVWRMMNGGDILGKRAHHRWRPGVCMGAVRSNYWCALSASVVKASPKQQSPREVSSRLLQSN